MKMTRVRRPSIRYGLAASLLLPAVYAWASSPAPIGFDDQTNGFESQTQMDNDRGQFDSVELIADGLGPVYNAQSCRECHQNPVSGSATQVNELRAGRLVNGVFREARGGSLIQDRAIAAAIQERVSNDFNVRTFRTSLNVLGDGFVEAIDDNTFVNIQAAQPAGVKGTIVRVLVPGGSTTPRVARFGWKDQHASLLAFAADAYLNEMGITSPLFPNENTSLGNSVAAFDQVPDPEDPATSSAPFGADVEAFTRFMRSTMAPAPDANLLATSDAQAGSQLFVSIGCSACHVPSITTALTGTQFPGFTVPAALGDKTINPYSDFLLHDINTGDGIVQGQAAGNLIRTAPLWGLRTRTRLMHDGQTLTREDAIARHGNQASAATQGFNGLTPIQQSQILTFLNAL